MDLADQCDQQNGILGTLPLPHKPEGPKPNGKCHYCDAPVAEGRRFCDSDCRDDYARLNR